MEVYITIEELKKIIANYYSVDTDKTEVEVHFIKDRNSTRVDEVILRVGRKE